MEKRDYKIDFLKAIGVCLIILAHTTIPEVVSQFRSFDVPLMVIISAILANRTYKSGNTLQYIKKRFIRLIIPTYIFLIVFFMIMLVFQRNNLTLELIVNSFLLQKNDSIGFVWIILVYFMCAILIPFINKINIKKTKNIICIFIIYITYEILAYFKIGFEYNIWYSIFYYIIPYGIITIIGYNYEKLTKKEKITLLVGNFIVNIIFLLINLLVNNKYVLYTDYKYPPTIYFLTYGIVVSIVLLEIVQNTDFKIYKSKFVEFIAQNSLWIYLIHILVLKIIENTVGEVNWVIQYMVIIMITLLSVLIKNKIINNLEKRFGLKSYTKVMKG